MFPSRTIPYMKAVIRKVAHHVPEQVLDNDALAASFEGWTPEKIFQKTGFQQRRVVGPGECASDLAEKAARELFASCALDPSQVDLLLFCTQSPDYFLPTTACLLQDRLGLPTSVAALDFNLGCSGYVYGLAMAKGFLEIGLARNALLLTGETYSRFIHPEDRSVRTIFGDAASATWLASVADGEPGSIGPFVLGTDGSGGPNLIVPMGASREPHVPGELTAQTDESGNRRTRANLYMNGPAIFEFTLRQVPRLVRQLLGQAGLDQSDVDLFVFHQASRFMLERLRRSAGIEASRFLVGLENCGNTVSATIPMMLEEGLAREQVRPGQRLMLVGFGVGYSWGACMVEWAP